MIKLCKCGKVGTRMCVIGEYDTVLCDNCVSKNSDYNNQIEDLDEKSRGYPCCEYIYSKEGFDWNKKIEYEDYIPNRKVNHDKQSSPKRGSFWCPSCDRYKIRKGGKCKICGYKDNPRRNKK